MDGIFCSNFYWKLGGFTPCHNAWCGECYISEDKSHFHVNYLVTNSSQSASQTKEKDVLERDQRWKEKSIDPNDYHEARNGDHALTPFECDSCVFIKLKRRKPIMGDHKDNLLLVMIRRMNLDAF